MVLPGVTSSFTEVLGRAVGEAAQPCWFSCPAVMVSLHVLLPSISSHRGDLGAALELAAPPVFRRLKSLPEQQTRKSPAALPHPPFSVVYAPRTPPALPGGILILTVTPRPDLSVGRLPAKLEINFRSSGGFT